MTKEKNYSKRKFSPTRMILADFNRVAASFHRVTGLVEVDVTESLEKIEDIEKQDNYKVSMTAFATKCVSQVVKENPHLNSYRWRRKLVVFNDVDVSIVIEITTKEGKKVPYNYVIRKAQTKSVREITDEIRSYQDKKINEIDQLTRSGSSRYMGFFSYLPKWFRRFVIKQQLVNPFKLKKLIGTVGVTSLGMFLKGQGGWAIPFADKTLNIALGAIKEIAVIRYGRAEERKLLCVTFLIDHDIVDGAPATRFISQFSKMMGETLYLDDLDKI
ncbi:2-oxo acid dehydrogenase subunit E2 [Candidatus Bathyarchaeota archaeon]|nr:2-oxo acid dehydrogenase subunit E2 [Candidatus Bathyarchaeota archaeon]